jgi:hypothetical protein
MDPPSDRRVRAHAWLFVAAVSIGAAAWYVATRIGQPIPGPMFTGLCQRIRDAGLAIQPGDWFCRPDPSSSHAIYAGASLLVAVGIALPCAILASTGRRVTALIPLLAAPVIDTGLFMGLWSSDSWLVRPPGPMGRDILLMAAPALAVAIAVRHRHRPKAPRRTRTALEASVVASATVAAVIVIEAHRMIDGHYRDLGGNPFGNHWAFAPAACVLWIFGALLGFDRRWWPWSIGLIAILLSLGPSTALVSPLQHFTTWAPFGEAVPLAAIGLVGSTTRPLAAWLDGRLARGSSTTNVNVAARTQTAAEPLERARRFRPVVVLNALAAAALAISLLMFQTDPMPAHVGTNLPTFLGTRALDQDVRTKMDLREAITAMDGYRVDQATYAGFDAATGKKSDPELAWQDGPLAPALNGAWPALRVSVDTATRDTARVVALSASGNAFCLERTAAGLTYGRGTTTSPEPAKHASQMIRDAITRCGSTRWSASAVRPFPLNDMCGGRDDGYVICRAVQALLVQIMAHPTVRSWRT